MNKLIKLLIIIFTVFFLSLYLSRYTLIFTENSNVLTEEAIKQFEQDLKNGKQINPKDYLPKEKDYNNKASKLSLKISNYIELTFRKTIKIIIKYFENN